MKWSSEAAQELNKRLNIRDMKSLFSALTPWQATMNIGTNYLANSFLALIRVYDDERNDNYVCCFNTNKNQCFYYSENGSPWTKGADFYLHIYDSLKGHGW